MAAIDCNLKFVGNMNKVQRTGKLCNQKLEEKSLATLKFAARYSIYSSQSTEIDLSLSQSIILNIIYGLIEGDIGFYLPLIEISNTLVQLQSSYLKVWLRDDFNFDRNDLIKMFKSLNDIMDITQRLSSLFVVLSEKYNVAAPCIGIYISDEAAACSITSDLSSKESESSDCVPSNPGTSKGDTYIDLPEEEMQLHLKKAVVANDEAAITALVEAGAVIDDEMENGDTLLHLAVSNSNVDAVRLLLKLGAIPNWRNRDYITPIQMAVALNSNVIVETLIQFGADVNQSSSESCTLLHEAASKGNTDVLKVLVRLGANIDVKNNYGYTPLHLAVKGNHLEAVVALAEAGADINVLSTDGEAPIHIAVAAGQKKILKSLIRFRPNLSIKTRSGLTVLHLANDRHIVKLLTSSGADVNILSDSGETSLHCAARKGCIEIAKALIASNATIDCLDGKRVTPLLVALKEERGEMVRLLVASGADVNFKDTEDNLNSLLHWAVKEEKLNCVKLLLDAGADVNVRNAQSNTPLHFSSNVGNLTITELLINKGADVNLENNTRETPYHYAALNGHLEVAKFLLEKGAQPNKIKLDTGTISDQVYSFSCIRPTGILQNPVEKGPFYVITPISTSAPVQNLIQQPPTTLPTSTAGNAFNFMCGPSVTSAPSSSIFGNPVSSLGLGVTSAPSRPVYLFSKPICSSSVPTSSPFSFSFGKRHVTSTASSSSPSGLSSSEASNNPVVVTAPTFSSSLFGQVKNLNNVPNLKK